MAWKKKKKKKKKRKKKKKKQKENYLSYREVRASEGSSYWESINNHDTCILTLAFQTQKTMQQIIHQ